MGGTCVLCFLFIKFETERVQDTTSILPRVVGTMLQPGRGMTDEIEADCRRKPESGEKRYA